MNATLEQIYARHDRKVLLEQVYVKAGAPIGNTNATKRNRVTGLNDELVVKEEEVAPGVFVDSGIAHHIRKLNLAGFKTFGSDSSMKSDHPKHDAKQKGAPYIMFDNPSKSQLSEISKSASKSAGSVSPPGPGWKYAQVTFDKGSDKEISETFDKFTNHLVGSNLSASLASRIETLLARDNRPTYYATDQPELHNAVRDRAQAIYQRAVDRSVDYAAAKAAKLAADRKVEAKKRAAAEEEIILLFLMLMADASEEAYETSTAGLEGVLGEEPEVVPPAVLKEFVEQRRAVLSGFPIEMSQRLTRIVTDGIERGQTDREIRSTIAKEASAIKKGQGSVVSLTEAQAVYGASQCRLLQRAGFETCLWVTQGDEKVRQSHRECEEAGEITIGHEFPNGLRFPGDPQGSAAEVVNCRCLLTGGRRKQS